MTGITKYVLNRIDFNNTKEYTVEKSKDHKNVLLTHKNGKKVYIGSKYNVGRDIEKIFNDIGHINNETTIIIFGLAAGEHILELLNKTINRILVVEPDINVLNTFMKLEYSKKIIENDRISICIANEDLNTVINAFIKDFDINDVKLVHYANYEMIFKEEYIELMKEYKDCAHTRILNINTSIMFSKHIFATFMRNMKHIIKNTPINYLKNCFNAIPAVIVSAGPSLEKNIHLLKEVKDKFVIICGNRTLKPLLDIGVEPDFVCVVDAQNFCYDMMKSVLHSTVPLVFCEQSNNKLVNAYKGKKIFFREGVTLKNSANKLLGHDVDVLWQGGSVAHACTALAQYLGCNPIMFIGQDLAYTNELAHADITDVSKCNGNIDLNTAKIYVDDINGNKVRTTSVLNFYRKNFEAYIKRNKNITFINSTEGGANIEGTEIIPLKEVINKYCDCAKDMNVMSKLLRDDYIDGKYVKEKMKEEKLLFEDLKENCDEQLKKIEIVSQKDTLSQSKKIKKVFKEVNELIEKLEDIKLINPLLEPILYKILMNKNFSEVENETELEKLDKVKKQIEILCKQLNDCLDFALLYVDEAIDGIEGGK